MRMSGSSKAFLVILIVLAGGFFGVLYTYNAAGAGSAPSEAEAVSVEIPEGANAQQVGELLAQQDVVDSATVFRLLARFDDRSNQIQPGVYDLRTGMGVDEVLAELAKPREQAPIFTVTIPEGLTISETLRRMVQADGSPFNLRQLRRALPRVAVPRYVPVGELPEGAQVYEGLLFPATYEFFVDERPDVVLSQLVEQTTEVLSGVTPPNGVTRYDVLTIASMIEREAKLAREQPIMSSVIQNRLDVPMRLQIDATVQYAQGEQKERLLFSDLEIDSAWNTYEVDGLPPTPIAGAGASAIRAAANPARTDFLYYVVCDPSTGQHAFATSNSEHAANVADYREVQANGGSFCEQ